MKELASVNATPFGFELFADNSKKYVLNRSKINAAAPYYLSLVEPYKEFLTGMFYRKDSKDYYGKLSNGKHIRIEIQNQSAIIEIR